MPAMRLGRAALIAAVAALSMVPPAAHSQAPTPGPAAGAAGDLDAGAGAGDPGVDPSADPASRDDDDDDDDGDDDSDAGVLSPPPSAPDQRDRWLTEQLDRALARADLGGGTVGAAVVDVSTGRTLWAHQADRPLNLASVTKVLTTAAALHVLGPAFRWRTTLLADDFDPGTGVVHGDLIVRGRGDPTLTAADLRDLVRQLEWKGVERVDGSLVFDGSYFDDVDEPPRFDDQPRERAGFRAPVGAASLERNSVTVVVTADRQGLGLARVTLDPPAGDYVRVVDASVATVTSGRTRIYVATRVKRDRLELRVSGQILADDGVGFARRRIDDPVRLFAEVLRAQLDDAGIRVRGRKVERGPAPPDAVVVAEHDSAPLADVIRVMDKYSDNYVAETVLKTIGAESRPPPADGADPVPATWADGLGAVHAYLRDQAGVATDAIRLENGSGLFDSTAISAGAVTQVLVAAWRDFRVGPELASALSLAGVDGTLRRRLAGDATRGRVRAKTGTLASVSSLAGYAGTDTGHPLAFAVIGNDLAGSGRRRARRLQDAIAAIVVAYADGR